ncbi:bifunctional hydroxymethylpyrimidine kinase/phosphomethylpyrimidine kinase [Pseudonocardia sp. DSM 110487]|uniref:bifunctional heptose 7-phosphate kinase/heptose 1-phosphate adenyltransferase n=1 Tax=Pseudonocardia sp. DSM 110487 TaxID=2865833 RepID=UPI001C694F12|nr:PfkB family carbohydrate kinase [Pseudonocardia sp. DSM 110487]QYN31895.1 bifunctional hydroxymethylpyrimidine kinase/phosphomethylpyrimidine kinase [Pseudonocardia sp. DSM 110487]
MSARPVVVVGDALLDVDVEGTVERMCPDAPAPVLDVGDESARPGGAGLAAALVAGRGAPVRLVTALERDEPGRRLFDLLDGTLDVLAGPAMGGTVVKCRWRTGGRTLLRTDHGRGVPAPRFAARLGLGRVLAGAGAVLVSDYGRGVAADPQVRGALTRAVARGVPVVWDPHPRGPEPVPGVTLATPNLAEARRAVAGPDGTADRVGPELAGRLVELWDARAVAVTLGSGGAVVRHRDGSGSETLAPAVDGGDPCGAGDHFAGGVAAALAAGADVDDAVAEAVREAAGFVERGGGATVRRRGNRWLQAAEPDLVAGTPPSGHRVA